MNMTSLKYQVFSLTSLPPFLKKGIKKKGKKQPQHHFQISAEYTRNKNKMNANQPALLQSQYKGSCSKTISGLKPKKSLKYLPTYNHHHRHPSLTPQTVQAHTSVNSTQFQWCLCLPKCHPHFTDRACHRWMRLTQQSSTPTAHTHPRTHPHPREISLWHSRLSCYSKGCRQGCCESRSHRLEGGVLRPRRVLWGRLGLFSHVSKGGTIHEDI